MKLRNKKTGETGYYLHTHRDHKDGHIKVAVLKDGVPFSEFKPYEPIYDYDSLAELNEGWEDYEEAKENYILNFNGDTLRWDNDKRDRKITKQLQEIGNYFETEEEAEKAVEKLKAWKRLKDKGFKFNGWEDSPAEDDFDMIWFTMKAKVWDVETQEALDLLFGGEE